MQYTIDVSGLRLHPGAHCGFEEDRFEFSIRLILMTKMEYRQKPAILGFIQAGGRSSRMGTDKSWLEIEGRPMIEQVLIAARPVVNSLSIVINAANPQAERYERLAAYLNARVIADLHDHLGPLGGVHTSLTNCKRDESALILACDMPFITTDFLAFLVDIHLREAAELTLPVDHEGRLQPLAGVYSASCLPAAEQMLTEDLLRVDGLCQRVRTRRIAFQEYASLKNAKNLFLNINSLEEIKRQKAKGKRQK